jgi:hypothetical protein
VRSVPGRVLLVCALAAALPLQSCGEEDERRRGVDARALLESGFSRPISSSMAEIDLELSVDGVRELSEPVSFSAEGPYVSGKGERIPSVDWAFDADLAGYGLDGEVVSTGENVFLSLFGDNYQVGEEAVGAANAEIQAATAAAGGVPEPLADLGVQPLDWFGRPTYEGDEEVAGVDTAHVTGRLRAEQVTEDLNAVGSRIGIPRGATFRGGTIEAWIGIEDELLRELTVLGDFTVTPARREALRGTTGGRLGLEIVLAEVGDQQEITIPEGGGFKPIGRLLESINDLTSGAFDLGLA